MLEYSSCATKLANVLLRIFATSLDLPENWFEDKCDKPMSSLRLLHYPPKPRDEPRFGCGAHSDYGCCTIFAQDTAGGLQLLSKSGEWVDVPCEEDTLVINIGDMMQRWTNDKYTSTIHRVLNPVDNHRFSAPFFFDPNFDATIECIESCKGETGPKYPTIKFGDHLEDMYHSTFNVTKSQ